VGLGLAVAVVGGVVRFANTEPPFRSGEWLGDVALAAVVAAPALLAVLSLRGRPALLTTAGALGIAQAVLDIPFSLLLLVPAALYLAASRNPPVAVGLARRVASTLVAVVLGIAAFWALFVLRADPACYAVVQHDGVRTTVEVPAGRFVHPSGISMSSGQLPAGTLESGCTSDTISPWEGAASLGIIATLIAASWALAGPRERSPEPLVGVTTA
jgi:hypothetical protein